MKLSRNRQQQTIGKYFAAENGKKPPPGLVTNDKMKDFAKSFYLHLRLLSHSIWQLSRSCSQTCIHTHSHSHTHTRTHTHPYSPTLTHNIPYSLTNTHSHVHLQTFDDAPTLKLTHTHTHSLSHAD